MGYAVELLFDDASTESVFVLSDRLAQAGLRPPRVGDPEYPHITLFVAEEIQRQPLVKKLSCYQFPTAPTVTLATLGRFDANPGVIYLVPQPDFPLHALHRDLFQQVSQLLSGINPHYLPANWTPHVTLADQLSPANLANAITVVGSVDPVAARITDLIIVEFEGPLRVVTDYLVIPNGSEETDIWLAYATAMASEDYFDAHEILERLWRCSHGIKQQSAIWFAALFVHWSQGRYSGAMKILDKIMRDFRRYPMALRPVMNKWRKSLTMGEPCPGMTPYERLCLVRWGQHVAADVSE